MSPSPQETIPAPQDNSSEPGLSFGTAGLRAPVGVGPDRMNVATVTRATAGVADWLIAQHPERPAADIAVAVAHDARYGSETFARATAEVFAAKGFTVTLLGGNNPTPVLAWLVRDRGLDAGVQITASHNPKGDNGYKLYLSGGSQLVSPADREIEAAIAAQPVAEEVARSRSVQLELGASQGYEAAISGPVVSSENAVLSARRSLTIAYTPMHGVGGDTLESVLQANGFADIHAVAAQRWPDPEFPSVDFPNPEEPCATDQLLALGKEVGADLLIALDPDADRCMIGVPTGNDPAYRMLSGNEAGPLLARRVLSGVAADATAPPVVATTYVSSQLLGVMAQASGWEYVETKTGFKHLARAAEDRPGELAFAYEEAIGTCPSPGIVADKDGIATALVAAAWAAELAAAGRSLADELAAIEQEFGCFRSSQLSIRLESIAQATDVIKKFAAAPPENLAGATMSAELLGEEAAEGLRLVGNADGVALRVVARPSGTEPKAKFYLEAVGEAAGREQVEAALAALEVDIPRAVEAVAGVS